MKVYGKTDTGKVRNNNQDSFRIVTVDKYTVGIVCDGMGGAAGGSTASNTACDTFIDYIKEQIETGVTPEEFEGLLRKGAEKANENVYTASRNDKELEGMGTTLCAFITDSENVCAISIGDSRLYMFSHGKVYQLSHDHSYVQVLLDSGAITKEESRNHPNKNIITRAVGTQKEVECDTFVMPFDMDGLLLCSDGLTNYVTDDELSELFCQYSNEIETLADTYIEKANDGGGGDNITVLVAIGDTNSANNSER